MTVPIRPSKSLHHSAHNSRATNSGSKAMEAKRARANAILRTIVTALLLTGGFIFFSINKWSPWLLHDLPVSGLSSTTSMLFSTIPSTPFRVFGPMPSSGIPPLITDFMEELDAAGTGSAQMSFNFYTQAQQRTFVQQYCHDSLAQFDALASQYATQLWKYCVMATQQGNVYWDSEQVTLTVLWQDLLPNAQSSVAIALPDDRWHPGFLYLAPSSLPMASTFLRYWTTTSTTDTREPVAPRVTSWTLWQAQCTFGEEVEHATCPVPYKGHCCQVWSQQEENGRQEAPILLIRDPWLSKHDREEATPSTNVPFAFIDRPDEMTDASLGMDMDHLPFVATVREYPTGATPATLLETPNFFDILLMNDCLPSGKECFKCLKTGYDGDQGGDCQLCQAQCPCYCQALCQIRPPPKRLMAEWKVTRPRVSKDPERLIPRIIHQTWYEPVTKEKYPNMSRLIESFRQSGWHYEFYDDDRAAQFLQAHFPPAVREAYDAILPGAFKADLFRYCVLLIMGGVYADMDIMLESNLDELIPPSVGFMTPQDTPDMTLGHRHCLWNGFLAAAPGHPFLAQTVQNVVNHARNRYTSVDYDDMLCPNPVLAVSHTVVSSLKAASKLWIVNMAEYRATHSLSLLLRVLRSRILCLQRVLVSWGPASTMYFNCIVRQDLNPAILNCFPIIMAKKTTMQTT